MTMRKFRDRIKEPEADLRLNRLYTTLAKSAHIHIQTINVDFNKSKIIFRTSNYQETIIRDSIEIISNKDIVCNDALSYDIHGVWKELLHIIQEPTAHKPMLLNTRKKPLFCGRVEVG